MSLKFEYLVLYRRYHHLIFDLLHKLITTLYRERVPPPASRDGPQDNVSSLPFLAVFFTIVSYNDLYRFIYQEP